MLAWADSYLIPVPKRLSDVYTEPAEAKALPPDGWDGDITP